MSSDERNRKEILLSRSLRNQHSSISQEPWTLNMGLTHLDTLAHLLMNLFFFKNIYLSPYLAAPVLSFYCSAQASV